MKAAGLLALTVLLVLALGGVARPVRAQSGVGAIVSTPLAAGWNNVAYLGPRTAATSLALSVGPSLRSIWSFDAPTQTWRGFDRRAADLSDLGEIAPGEALWLVMDAPGALNVSRPGPIGVPLLYPGHNNVVYPLGEAPVAAAAALLGGRVSTFWLWDEGGQRWLGADGRSAAASQFATLQPERVYWLRLEPGPPITLTGITVGGHVAPLAAAAPTAAPTPRPCTRFPARQPTIAELRTTFNRAAFNRLATDPSFALHPLETQPDGDGGVVPGSAPATLLKAIAWVESSWRHAGAEVERGQSGWAVLSTSCAVGVMQVLSGMPVREPADARQQVIGSDHVANIAAGTRILAEKWNSAPTYIPVVRSRSPQILEDWYYAVWAYHCFGPRCTEIGLRDNPDDPTLTWPRPAYNSPEQIGSGSRFSRSDYPYQELVYGLIRHPPIVGGAPLWNALPVVLPPKGVVGFPDAKPFDRPAATTDPTRPDDP